MCYFKKYKKYLVFAAISPFIYSININGMAKTNKWVTTQFVSSNALYYVTKLTIYTSFVRTLGN